MADLTTIILTYNEQLNIKDCIESVKGISKRIIVADSYSTDKTVEIAESLGAEVIRNKWINHSSQYRWAESTAGIKTRWVMRLDADERLTPASAQEIEQLCKSNENTDVNGIIVRFEVNFLGKKLRHGGIYPFRKLLVYKFGLAEMEDRNMDEHIVLLEGRCTELKNDSLHYDYKDITAWIDKHNKYSSREALDYFNLAESKKNTALNLNRSARIKRFIKMKIYYKLPMGMRAHLYYCYRYYLKLGFLDGKEGKIFAFLQAYWYRFLVDVKIYERMKNEKED